MKTLSIFILLLSSQLTFASYHELNVSDRVINFSSYCKSGRVTIFELSTPGCLPCESLRKYLLSQNYDTAKVDIYHCLISKGPAKEMWGFCEGVTSVPVVYIFGPTKNAIKIMRPEDKDFTAERINRIINDLLLESWTHYRESLVAINNFSRVTDTRLTDHNKTPQQTPAVSEDTKNKKNNTVDKLQKSLEQAKDSINVLYSNIEFLKWQNDSLSARKDSFQNKIELFRTKLEDIKKVFE